MTTNHYRIDKLYSLPDCGVLKAFVDLVINDSFIIRGVRVLQGKKGLFVGLPKEQGKDGKWFDTVVVTKAEVYEELSSLILTEYNARQAQTGEKPNDNKSQV